MGEIILDLKDCKIFKDNSLKIENKLTFVFGKNGTGKSTLTALFKSQVQNYDIRCFQGFDGIVGDDKRLNAVILGEENNEIDKQIKVLEKDIFYNENKIKEIEEETLYSEFKPNNLWKKIEDKRNYYDEQNKKINDFYSKAAKDIKNLNNPQISLTSYNTKNFQSEIKKANLLRSEEMEKHKSIIRTDLKIATEILYSKIDFKKLLSMTNHLLTMKISEKEIIHEISGNVEKTKFAEEGLHIHAINEKCSFCGSLVTKDRYEKLQRYFSADEVQEFRDDISNNIGLIKNKITQVENTELQVNDFYPEYVDEINRIKSKFDEKKLAILTFLSKLNEVSDKKLKEIFEESEILELKIPSSLEEEIKLYNEKVVKNNESNLKVKKKEAKNKLRYHEIKKELDKFNYEDEKSRLNELKVNYDVGKSVLDNENKKITILKEEINKKQNKIIELQAKTKNEKILADEINKKLEHYVNFELEYLEESAKQGYYQVKCKNTGDYRNITQLSSGEKNIIAFLYFIQKLNEIDNSKSNFKKFIIFDDPMTSNDDTMQYLIIEELDQLIKKLTNDDKIIIMTHNKHFYLNVKYNYKNYNKNKFLRLFSDGVYTTIVKINKLDEDFKTNYEELWKELEFIYREAPSSSMLLNPIRRIIETYTNFNSINKNNMLSHVSGAMKLFNVNSHSIDDLEAELNGRDKEAVIRMMKKCFEEEHALDHFNKYCSIT